MYLLMYTKFRGYFDLVSYFELDILTFRLIAERRSSRVVLVRTFWRFRGNQK